VAIPWRAIDGNAISLQVTAQPVDIIDPIRQMPEIATTGVFFRIPVVSQLDHRSFVFPCPLFVVRRRKKHQGKPAFFTALATDFNHAQQIEKVQSLIQVADPNHCVKVLHKVFCSFSQLSEHQILVSGLLIRKIGTQRREAGPMITIVSRLFQHRLSLSKIEIALSVSERPVKTYFSTINSPYLG
jgi:hypothetical protein